MIKMMGVVSAHHFERELLFLFKAILVEAW